MHESSTQSKLVAVVAAATAMALGLLAVCLPAYVQRQEPMPAPLFPWVRTGVETLSALNAGLLFCAGVVLGVAFCRRGSRSRPLVLGMLTMGSFPLFAFAEMLADPTSHNLWPLEFGMYAIVGLIAVAGSHIGRRLVRHAAPARSRASTT